MVGALLRPALFPMLDFNLFDCPCHLYKFFARRIFVKDPIRILIADDHTVVRGGIRA
jgi:hypothetical protein